MENTPRLYETLVHVLSQHENWVDRRHLKTLAWMMVGLVQARVVSLPAWTPYVHSRAVYAQSLVRRFDRWLQNTRIEVHQLYGPLIQQALGEWGNNVLYLALDTSTLWETYCLVRLAIIDRGRAIPIVWKVMQHSSSSVAYDVYNAMVDKVVTLLPCQCKVIFLADRGFADTPLMNHLQRVKWHGRSRITRSFWRYRRGHRPCQGSRIALSPGETRLWPAVSITRSRYGSVHLAMARRHDGKEYWFVVSDEPTDVKTCEEYGWRCDIAENFLDDKSHGFQLESSLIRSAAALERRCLVLAITTLYLVAQGTEVVKQGQRRWVDPPWFRGQSYLKIGWNGVKLALSRGYELVTRWHLAAGADPEPAMASKRQYQKNLRCVSALAGQDAAA